MDVQNRPDLPALDDRTQSIDVVIRGYDKAQVHKLLHRLNQDLRVAQADKESAARHAADLTKRLADARAETESARSSAQESGEPNFGTMGARISNMLKLAEEEATDIRRVAKEEQTRSRLEIESQAKESSWLQAEAKDSAKRLAEEAQDEARRGLERAQNGAARILADAQKQADEVAAHARSSAEHAESQSKARMAKIEKDFDQTLKSRRAEAARIEQERDQSSRHDAKARIEQSQNKSDEMVSLAERRVADLNTQRAAIHTWLTQLRKILATVPDFQPAPGSASSAPAVRAESPAPARGSTQSEGEGTAPPTQLRVDAADATPGHAIGNGNGNGASNGNGNGHGSTHDAEPDSADSSSKARDSSEPAHTSVRAAVVTESSSGTSDVTALDPEAVLAYRHQRRRGR